MQRGFSMKLAIPKINEGWWSSSKRELNQIVEDYNRSIWPKEKDPVTLKPWKPRKPPTGNWPILKKTGLMQDSAQFKPGRKPMEFIVKTTNYGPYMQYGTKTVPARRWLGIGPQLFDSMAKVIGQNMFKKGKTITRIP